MHLFCSSNVCEAHTVEHILFQCKNVKNILRILWQKIIEKMPIPMIEEFNSRTTREKVIYLQLFTWGNHKRVVRNI